MCLPCLCTLTKSQKNFCATSLGRDMPALWYGFKTMSPLPSTPTVYRRLILCRNHVFQEFIAERLVGHSVDEEQAAAALCKHCGITSRSELNGNTRAQEFFDAIVLDFENWNPNADPF